LDTHRGPNRRERSHGGTDVGSTTGEAVAFAVLKILRSKHHQELFLKMENSRVRSAFIGWLGSYSIPYGAKQIGGLQPKRLGRYYDPKVTKRLRKNRSLFILAIYPFELEGARLRAETRCAGGFWQRLLLAAVIRAACRSRGARGTGSDRRIPPGRERRGRRRGGEGSRRRWDLNGGGCE
jgi:hypothetical protein